MKKRENEIISNLSFPNTQIEKEISEIVLRINKLDKLIKKEAEIELKEFGMTNENNYRLNVYEDFHELIKNYFLYE